MKVSNTDRPLLRSPPSERQHQSAVDVTDEDMEKKRGKIN